MTEHDETRGRTTDPMDDPDRTEGLDPGAFVGQRPERQAPTIPGGVRPDDERIAAHSTQTGDTDVPRDDDRREAGQDH